MQQQQQQSAYAVVRWYWNADTTPPGARDHCHPNETLWQPFPDPVCALLTAERTRGAHGTVRVGQRHVVDLATQIQTNELTGFRRAVVHHGQSHQERAALAAKASPPGMLAPPGMPAPRVARTSSIWKRTPARLPV